MRQRQSYVSERHRQEPIRLDQPPVPGFFVRRLVRGGPWVGAQITLDADGSYRVMLDGKWEGPSREPWSLPLMHEVFLAQRCTEAEVKFRVGLKRWAEIYSPTHPAANPRRPLDPGDLPVVI